MPGKEGPGLLQPSILLDFKLLGDFTEDGLSYSVVLVGTGCGIDELERLEHPSDPAKHLVVEFDSSIGLLGGKTEFLTRAAVASRGLEPGDLRFVVLLERRVCLLLQPVEELAELAFDMEEVALLGSGGEHLMGAREDRGSGIADQKGRVQALLVPQAAKQLLPGRFGTIVGHFDPAQGLGLDINDHQYAAAGEEQLVEREGLDRSKVELTEPGFCGRLRLVEGIPDGAEAHDKAQKHGA